MFLAETPFLSYLTVKDLIIEYRRFFLVQANVRHRTIVVAAVCAHFNVHLNVPLSRLSAT